ncbi:MAG: hypothetical protein ABL962_19855 [Fimbriimonadaceae bacterium]
MELLPGRHGSGDGERKAAMTRQMSYEPLPASVLFVLVLAVIVPIMMSNEWNLPTYQVIVKTTVMVCQ